MRNHNQAALEGLVSQAPSFSHENHGLRFYRLILRVPRLSGQEDLLPVLLPESLLPAVWPMGEADGGGMPAGESTADAASLSENVDAPEDDAGEAGESDAVSPPREDLYIPRPLRMEGQLRSFNNRTGVGSRLVLTVYAQSVEPARGTPCNEIVLSGTVCKEPVFRRTPLGRSICDLMLAVPRRYGRSDYLPVIAWGNLARRTSRLSPGDPLSFEGRIQSRIYHKTTEDGTEERTAYEVSMMRLAEEEEEA